MESTTGLSRRRFLGSVVGMAGLVTVPRIALPAPAEQSDEEIFRQKMTLAQTKLLGKKPLGDVMVELGKSFVGTPYVGHTLEEPGPEHLVVNLHGLDCLTFVESTLVLARVVKLQKRTFGEFRNQLTLVRYRSGHLNGYPSRLHYFTDWMSDNAAKNVVKDMTVAFGGASYRKKIDFMTTHTSSYNQLIDTLFVQQIAKKEEALSANDLFMIPKEQIASMQGRLHSGDIIGTVTSMEGIDIAHTGMVLVENGVPKFLHASLSGKQVMISTGSLAEYVASVSKNVGIVVGRPLEPA
jgi:hypothetical protein